MRYFVISDIHSHYDAMISSLQKAGFNDKDNNHHLIVIGDLFDRGVDAIKVYKYLSSLTDAQKATIIIGNHDLFLLDFMDKKFEKVLFNMKHNGFDKTLEAFSGLNVNIHRFEEVHNQIISNFPNLKGWLNSFLPFLEIGKYIFVHGGIDGTKKHWKQTPLYDLVWNREVLLEPINNRIVVAGHHRTATIRTKSLDYRKLFKKNPKMFDILRLEGKILIDGFVEVSNLLNVLILDEKDIL